MVAQGPPLLQVSARGPCLTGRWPAAGIILGQQEAG
jgi:hypothetical protein